MPPRRKRNLKADLAEDGSLSEKKSKSDTSVMVGSGQKQANKKNRRKPNTKNDTEEKIQIEATEVSLKNTSRRSSRLSEQTLQQSNGGDSSEDINSHMKTEDEKKPLKSHKQVTKRSSRSTNRKKDVVLKEDRADCGKMCLEISGVTEGNFNEKEEQGTDLHEAHGNSNVNIIKTEVLEAVEFLTSSDGDSDFQVEEKKLRLASSQKRNDTTKRRNVQSGQKQASKKNRQKRDTKNDTEEKIQIEAIEVPSVSLKNTSRRSSRFSGKTLKQSNDGDSDENINGQITTADKNKSLKTHDKLTKKSSRSTNRKKDVVFKEEREDCDKMSLEISGVTEGNVNEKEEKGADLHESHGNLDVNIIRTEVAVAVEFLTSSENDSDFEVEEKKLRLTSSQKRNDTTKRRNVKNKNEKRPKNAQAKSSADVDLMDDSIVTNKNKKRKRKVKDDGSTGQQIQENSKDLNKNNQNEISLQENNLKIWKKDNKSDRKSKNKGENENMSAVKEKQESILAVDPSDVTAVLLSMEGLCAKGDNSPPGITVKKDSSSSIMTSDEEELMSSDDEEADWEDVEDHQLQKSPKKNQLPNEPVEITLDAPQFLKKRKKKQFDWKAYLERRVNRFKRELREDLHKVELLCLLSRGLFLSRLCNEEDLQCHALSLVPSDFIGRPAKSFTTAFLLKLTQWFKSKFKVIPDLTDQENNMNECVQKRFEEQQVSCMLEFVLMFIILLRGIGLDVRLVMSLQPQNLKPARIDTSKKPQGEKSTAATESKIDCKSNHKESSVVKGKQTSTSKSKKSVKSKNQESKSVYFNKSKLSSAKSSKYFQQKKNKKSLKNTADSDTVVEQDPRYKIKNKTLRSRGSKVKPSSYEQDCESDFDDSEDEFVPVSDDEDDDDEDDDDGDDNDDDHEEEEVKKHQKSSQGKTQRKNKSKKSLCDKRNGSSSEFEEDPVQYRSPTTSKPRKLKKDLLADSQKSSKKGCDQWPEVFLETENKWICINCVKGELNAPYAIESHATQPVHYVIAFDREGHLKDLTARYASKWLTDTRKIRVDSEWWQETLDLYKMPDVEGSQREDQLIKESLVQRPMPTSIGAFKGHPLYILRRHLLKFEAIYPESSVPLGYIRGEPIYARECVHILHSRENWLKEGRAVRIGEEPYKMVKSRPKWNKPKLDPDALDLECFGHWQTEVYIPLPAVDGKVPRNEYGNVELFKPSMLPAGTVHLKVPGLNRVARKLKLDCVPAMTGWDSHGGYSHPVLDGFIVCEEHKDILLAAWDEDQEMQKEREAEKKEKRVYGNWKLLIKSLLIKEKLKKRFDLQEKNDECSSTTCDITEGEKANDYDMSWPRQETTQKKLKGKKKSKFSDVETM